MPLGVVPLGEVAVAAQFLAGIDWRVRATRTPALVEEAGWRPTPGSELFHTGFTVNDGGGALTDGRWLTGTLLQGGGLRP